MIYAGGGVDELTMTSTDKTGTSGECHALQCTGFGIEGEGVRWTSDLEQVNIVCGAGDDSITITGVDGSTQLLTVDGGSGSDEYIIVSTATGFDKFLGALTIADNYSPTSKRSGINTLIVDQGT